MHWKSLAWIALGAAGIAGCSSTTARQSGVAVRAQADAPPYVATALATVSPDNRRIEPTEPPAASQLLPPPPAALATGVVHPASNEEPSAPGKKEPSTGR